jgi:LPXTG-motif cell wall-anchored protein
MDTTTLIRLIAGAGFVLLLFVLIQRRRKRVD